MVTFTTEASANLCYQPERAVIVVGDTGISIDFGRGITRLSPAACCIVESAIRSLNLLTRTVEHGN